MPEEADSTNPRTEPSEPRRTAPARNFPVVGVGASAGGIDALKRMLPKLEAGCGMAFVVVQHLAPSHGSVLGELLARSSSLPVAQIETDTEVQPGHIYVIPPNTSLTIHDGRLRLAPLIAARGPR